MDEVQGWWRSVRRSFTAALRIERVFSDPVAIARALAAVVGAAVLGALLDDPLAWAMTTVGAFICGIGTLLAPLRHRAVNAAALGAAFTLAALAGVFLHPLGWWFLLPLGAVAYAAGLWRALGVAPGIRACLVAIGLMITADLAPSTAAGLTMVGWIGAGAAMVAAAQLLPPYGRRLPAQRRALAALYQSLADYARLGADPAVRLPSAPFTAARRALDLLPGFSRPAAAPLYGLLAEAEAVRRTLHAARTPEALPRAATAAVLDAVARALLTGRTEDAEAAVPEGAGPDLAARLREALRLTAHWLAARGPEGLDGVLGAFPAVRPARAGARLLRAELRPGAPLFRHAVRIALGTVAAEAAGRALGDFWGNALPQHGFWAALTTMLVLFPDYGHTFARGWGRPIGSILGGLAAWAVLLPAWWTPGGLVAASVVLVALVYATLRVGQLVLNFFITAWIVFLVTRLGSAPHLIAWGRPADTLLGALIGLAVFVAVPTYHHDRLHTLVADWLDVQRRLLSALIAGYTAAGAFDPAAVDTLRGLARQSRERVESAAAGLAHEPRAHRAHWDAAALAAVQESLHEVARCGSLLYDLLPARDADAVPEAAELADAAADGLARLAAAVAARGTLPAGALRAGFDAVAAHSGLADLADPAAPDGVSRARSRLLTLGLRTATTLETLNTRLVPTPRAPDREPPRHARPRERAAH
ncbi:FUSC family protein [Streptomyces sp. NPDC047002]|uniref:FUSC family protein n=1 Tax=Streptomyces sp. NPDC047002 TaxID=3155475 RepID=UPI003455CD3E